MSFPLRARGFTLIEVMIAVVIVAILATVAVPSYRGYVLRANRTVAKSALSEVVSRQAGYMAEAKRYATKFSKLGWNPDDTLYVDREGNFRDTNTTGSVYSLALKGGATSSTCPATGDPSSGGTASQAAADTQTPERNYRVTIDGTATATAFTLTATAINAQTADTKCGAMCLSSTGIKSAGGTAPSECWTR